YPGVQQIRNRRPRLPGFRAPPSACTGYLLPEGNLQPFGKQHLDAHDHPLCMISAQHREERESHARTSISRRQAEVKGRSRPRYRFHPHSTAVPLDRLLAECESKSVAGVFFPVQALERLEYAALEFRVYSRTVVLHREHPFEIFSSGGNVNAWRSRATVFDSIPNQMVQDFSQDFEVSAHLR